MAVEKSSIEGNYYHTDILLVKIYQV